MADRLAIYDHVIQETQSQQKTTAEAGSNEDLYVDLVAKLNKDESQSGPKSHLEVLAEMRDYKRRRQSYRAKNVHITKKSYTEVIREVIDVHSGELSKLWQEEEREMKEAKASKHSSHRRQSEERRSTSVESRQSRASSRDRDGHGHSSRHKHKRSRERSRVEDDDGKGKRDSHSPEERRRHKKKKKKKKKE